MDETRKGTRESLRARLVAHLAEPQHRNAYYLMLNTGTGAAVGLVFWFLLARFAGLAASQIGVGYATVALGTMVAVLAKGGLDTALVRTVPGASRQEAARLLRFSTLVGVSIAVLLVIVFALASELSAAIPDATLLGWTLVGAIGTLLVITWLQDAYFLADGDARHSFERNLVFSAARLLLPLPVVALALPSPVALTWALALAASAAAAVAFARGLEPRRGREVPRREFLHSALRNVSGSAAEFLPGLLLAPLVLALDGPASAAYFGIAWTAASLLFLACAAISRSALAEMVRNGSAAEGAAIRRGARQLALLVAPATAVGAVLAPQILSVFGPLYASQGAPVMTILCASALFVAPAYFYLALLRAHERPLPLTIFPAAMVAALAVLAPLMETRFGLAGVAIAWLAANAPFGAYAAWKLRLAAREVTPHGPAAAFGRAPYVE